MYHRVRQKMRLVVCAILILVPNYQALPTIEDVVPETKPTTEPVDNYENNVIDFDDEFSVRFNNKYDVVPWRSTTDKHVKDSHRYTIVKDDLKSKPSVSDKLPSIVPKTNTDIINEPTTETDYSVIPLELISTTENYLLSIIESTTDQDLSVIPLAAAKRKVPTIEITQTVTLPPSTQETDTTTDTSRDVETTTNSLNETKVQTTVSTNQTLQKNKTQEKSDYSEVTTTSKHVSTTDRASYLETTTVNIGQYDFETKDLNRSETTTTRDIPIEILSTTADSTDVELNATEARTTNYDKAANSSSNKPVSANNRAPKALISNVKNDREIGNNTLISIKSNKTKNNDLNNANKTKTDEALKANSTNQNENVTRFTIDSIEEGEKDVPVFTELDAEDEEVPEDYYDAKDVVPTTAPKASALSVLVGLAGSVVESVVESVAERVVPKGIYDLFRRMQRQSEALEAERLRSREENGGLGQFGRGILKSISSGLSKPLSQLMAGAKDIGSLDSDRGFISSLASGVTSVATVATSMADSFKDRVQAIYPGTVWCGDGHSPTARSGELGLFFFTDTCCRQHDACKIYIKAGETKYGLTNTGLFTRSHCSCDAKFRECLRRTNSLVSAQIGLTYFNVLGPQCFRRAHPIVKCLKRTRITGQKCEEYEFDYTKPKMWQWFDNETF